MSIALDPARDAAAIRQMIALVAKRLHRGSTWMRAMEADLGVAPKYKGVARTVLPSYSFKTRRGP
ncbi:MAG TPA: hypothetical protein VJN18_30180 [Polyangiaceae bacterium]|nr:hypothetical protein [Polyangiaceae bacterium]